MDHGDPHHIAVERRRGHRRSRVAAPRASVPRLRRRMTPDPLEVQVKGVWNRWTERNDRSAGRIRIAFVRGRRRVNLRAGRQGESSLLIGFVANHQTGVEGVKESHEATNLEAFNATVLKSAEPLPRHPRRFGKVVLSQTPAASQSSHGIAKAWQRTSIDDSGDGLHGVNIRRRRWYV